MFKRTIQFALQFLKAAAVTLAVLTMVQTVWVCSSTDGGWNILGEHLVAGLPPMLRKSTVDVNEHPYAKTTAWMLSQADRIEANPKSSATDYMGAALAMSEGPRATGIYVPIPRIVGNTIWQRPMDDRDIVYRSLDESDLKTEQLAHRSLEFARRAIELEPDNRQWRRLSGLLIHLTTMMGRRNGLFDTSLIESAMRSDPDNAFYDYLLASREYEQALVSRSFDEGATYNSYDNLIQDEGLYRQSLHWYRNGMEKPVLSMGRYEEPLGRFYLASQGRVSEKLLCGTSWSVEFGKTVLCSRVEAAPWNAIEYHISLAEFDTAFYLFQTCSLRPAAQYAADGEPLVPPIRHGLLQIFTSILNNFFDKQPNSPLQAKVEKRLSQLSENLDDDERKYHAAINRQTDSSDWERLQLFEIASVGGIETAATGYLLLMLGVAGFVVSRLQLRKSGIETKRRASWIPLVAWATCFGITFAALGIVPSWYHEGTNYQIPLSIGFTVVALMVLGRLVWQTSCFVIAQGKLPDKNRNWRFHAARLFLVLLESLVFIVLMFSAIDRRFRHALVDIWNDLPRRILCEAFNFKPISTFGISGNSPADVLMQWGVHGGVFWTTGMWLVWMLGLEWLHTRPSEAGSFDGSTNTKSMRAWRTLAAISRSALKVGLILMIVAVASTTQWIDAMRIKYNVELARLQEHAEMPMHKP